MADTLDVAKSLESFTFIAGSTSVAEALALLRKAGVAFAIVGDISHLQTLVRESHLVSAASTENRSLAESLEHFPPLLLVDGEVTVLDAEELKQLAVLLQRTKAAGLVVYQGNQVRGIISRKTIANALPLTAIPLPGSERLYGLPQTPAQAYICHKCEQEDPPPPILLPSQGDRAPTCPKHWLHGPMTPLESEDE